MSDLAIDIRNVVKRYEEHVAVRALSLQVPRGSVYGLLGPNGAGKTTTIRMMLDIILPDSGTISLLGRPNTDRKVLNQIGYLPEERGLYKKMQVRRGLLFLPQRKGGGARPGAPRSREKIQPVRLATAGEKKGGGQSRRAVARHAAEGAVHRDAAARSRSGHSRRAVQRSRSDQRASAEGRHPRAKAPR